MIRTRLDKVDIQRNIKPLYGWTQATPKSGFIALDSNGDYNFDVEVFPGMVFAHVGGEQYDLVANASDTDLGLVAQFIGGAGIDEVRDEGIGAIAIWKLGPDAEFEILAPSFATSGDGAISPSTPKGTLLHGNLGGTTAANRGKLCTAAAASKTTNAVAVLLEVISADRIRIGGLSGTVA